MTRLTKTTARLFGHLTWALGGVLLQLVACTSIECPLQNEVSTCYSLYTGEQADTLRDTLNILTRRSDGVDTVLLNRGINLTSFKLPISCQSPEDTLIFAINDTLGQHTTDTVWLRKTDLPHFESVDCQALFYHQIEGVRTTHQRIDTIIIKRSFVDNDLSSPHFHISFKARP